MGLCCLSLWVRSAAQLPFAGLDLPKELVMDVNKPPFPIVNIIADSPPTDSGSASLLKSDRDAERNRAHAAAEEQANYAAVYNREVKRNNALLNRLSALKMLSRSFL